MTTTNIDAPIADVVGVEHRHDHPRSFVLLIKCPHCHKDHQHGGFLDELEAEGHGHRVAHCDDRALVAAGHRLDRRSRGYNIGPVPELLRDRLYGRLALTLARPGRRADPVTIRLSKAERIALDID